MERNIVTESCSTLRALGREVLRGRWKLAFLAFLTYNAAIYIPTIFSTALFADSAPVIFLLYSVLVTGPLLLGCAIFTLRLFRNEGPSIGQIFYGFERFGRSLALYLAICLFAFLWFIIPVAGIVLSVVAMIRYSQAFFIMADNYGIGAFESIARSKQMMLGNKAKYFLLCLSFIGWGLLASIPYALAGFLTEQDAATYEFTVGMVVVSFIGSVGYSALMAYMMAAMAAFYEMAAGNLKPGYIMSTAEVIDDNSNIKYE